MRKGLSADDAATLLQISASRLRSLAQAERLELRAGESVQLKRLALRLLSSGSTEEQEAARRTLEDLRQASGRDKLVE